MQVSHSSSTCCQEHVASEFPTPNPRDNSILIHAPVHQGPEPTPGEIQSYKS